MHGAVDLLPDFNVHSKKLVAAQLFQVCQKFDVHLLVAADSQLPACARTVIDVCVCV